MDDIVRADQLAVDMHLRVSEVMVSPSTGHVYIRIADRVIEFPPDELVEVA